MPLGTQIPSIPAPGQTVTNGTWGPPPPATGTTTGTQLRAQLGLGVPRPPPKPVAGYAAGTSDVQPTRYATSGQGGRPTAKDSPVGLVNSPLPPVNDWRVNAMGGGGAPPLATSPLGMPGRGMPATAGPTMNQPTSTPLPTENESAYYRIPNTMAPVAKPPPEVDFRTQMLRALPHMPANLAAQYLPYVMPRQIMPQEAAQQELLGLHQAARQQALGRARTQQDVDAANYEYMRNILSIASPSIAPLAFGASMGQGMTPTYPGDPDAGG